MIGVDTNVLIRFLVDDDAEEFRKATTFLTGRNADDPAYVSIIVLIEFIWVLRSRYRFDQEQVSFAIRSLLSTPALVFEEQQFLSRLVRGENVKPGDLADHLVSFCAQRAGCSHTVTLDVAASEAIPSMELLA